MYFDSVNPDYAATQVLDPQEYQVRWFVAYPYLCQVYHGTVGVWISALGIIITGTTSVLQHHLINIILEFVVILLLDKILSNNNVSTLLRRIVLLLLAVSPTVSTIAMTQYYIELPGTICMLGTVIIYDLAVNTECTAKQKIVVFSSFFLIGFAFYSYFNFLFFLLGFVLYFLFDKKFTYTMGTKILIASYGCLAGAVLYIAGYTQLAVYNTLNISSGLLPIIAWFFVWLICGIMLWLVILDKERVVYICTGILLLLGVTVLVLSGNYIQSTADSLDLGGYYSAGLLERIRIIFKFYYDAMTGQAAESLILQEQISVGWNILAYVFMIIMIAYISLSIICRRIINKTSAYMGIFVIYMMCCTAFATRMGTQHFIPLIFWTFMVLGMALQDISSIVKKHKSVYSDTNKNMVSKAIVVTGLAIIIILSGTVLLINRYMVIDRIWETGGRGYYTKQVNNMAKMALENQKAGENEIYIFPEWGFMTEFGYLTGNDIAFTTDYRTETIEKLLNMGYEVNILYWYDETGKNAANYKELVRGLNIKETINDYYNDDGKIVFSDLVLSLRE